MDAHEELEQLRDRVGHLEALVERLTGAPDVVRRAAAGHASSPAGVDRRRMLRHGLGLSAAAVAGVGLVDAVGSPAAAADGDSVLVSQTVAPTAATSDPTRILNPSTDEHAVTLFRADNFTDATVPIPDNTKAAIVGAIAGHESGPPSSVGVLGLAQFGAGVRGHSDGDTGVAGTSVFAVGVSGTSTGGTGVQAISSSGPALTATSTSGKGLLAASDSGEGVHATSTSNVGVVGYGPFGLVGNGTGGGGGTGVGATGATGVLSRGTSIGVDATGDTGVLAQGTTIGVHATSSAGTGVVAASASGAGVSASSGSSVGVRGTSGSATGVRGESTSGAGVTGVSTQAVGGHFQGGAAAVRLVPRSTTGHPVAGHHSRGELVVDRGGKLWLCTSPGTPGHWRQIAFV